MDETLAQALQRLKIMGPVSHGLLHIFALQGDTHAEQDISLLEGALQAGTLHVEAPHEAGSVPELRVVNDGTSQVLILEGDELIGAKQNRVVNSSVLVAAKSELVLLVSCVERGRWSYRSRAFTSGRGSPHLALQDSRSHLSEKLDAFDKLARDLSQGTSGVAVAIGERIILLELLAGPRSFARVFRKLLSGYAFESVGLSGPYGTPNTSAVRSFIEEVAKAAHEVHQAVGSGRDVRFEGDEISGYALIGERGVVHAVAFAG